MKRLGVRHYAVRLAIATPILLVAALISHVWHAKAEDSSRPVLHLDVGGTQEKPEFFLTASTVDGRHLGEFPAAGAVWSPEGKWFAFFTDRGRHLALANLAGEHRELFEFPAKTGSSIGWQPTWSPDGKTIAAITEDDSSHYWVVLIGLESGKLVSTQQLPEGVLHLPYYLSAADKFRWSPDGHKILVSWEKAVVLDVANAKAQPISAVHVIAEWAPQSDGVYYEKVDRDPSKGTTLGGFYLQKLDSSSPIKLADAEELQRLGWQISPLNAGLMALSPNGSQLAIAGGGAKVGTGHLRIYGLRPGEELDLKKPQHSFDLDGVITSLEWSPDGRSVALLTAGEQVKVQVLELATGKSKVLRVLTVLTSILHSGGDPERFEILMEKNLSWTQ